MLWLYARVALSNWSALPDTLKPALEAIALHGTEENFAVVEKLTPEAFEESVDAIRLAALDLHAYWDGASSGNAGQVPVKVDAKVGRNDPCPVAAARNISSAVCINRKGRKPLCFNPLLVVILLQ
ncbi:Predicted metal-binding protein related to the C-terminal domain of SecA [Citrobacter freundii]|nr:Predicted metal-binding protein related to the C-terminal domain of SecA [Citrobacter freundii]